MFGCNDRVTYGQTASELKNLISLVEHSGRGLIIRACFANTGPGAVLIAFNKSDMNVKSGGNSNCFMYKRATFLFIAANVKQNTVSYQKSIFNMLQWLSAGSVEDIVAGFHKCCKARKSANFNKLKRRFGQ